MITIFVGVRSFCPKGRPHRILFYQICYFGAVPSPRCVPSARDAERGGTGTLQKRLLATGTQSNSGMFLRSRLAFLQTAWLSPGRLGDCHGPKSGPRNDNVTVIASKSTSLTHFILKETAMFLRSHLAIFQTAWLFFPQCDLDVRREPIK